MGINIRVLRLRSTGWKSSLSGGLCVFLVYVGLLACVRGKKIGGWSHRRVGDLCFVLFVSFIMPSTLPSKTCCSAISDVDIADNNY